MLSLRSHVVEKSAWSIIVKELLVSLEEISLVDVEGVILVAVWGASVPQRAGKVVDLSVQICAIVLSPGIEGCSL